MGPRLILQDHWARWLFALAAFAAATTVDFVVQPLVESRIPLLPYYPALVLTGLCAGLIPATAVVLAGGLAVLAFWPLGTVWPPTRPADYIVIAFFALSGAMVVAVSSWARHLVLEFRRTGERLSMALAAGQMTTWEWNLRTGAVNFSAGAEALFGQAWTTARAAAAQMHPSDAERIRRTVGDALRGGTMYRVLSRINRADTHELRWIETTGRVHRDKRGVAVRVSGVSADVTERQRALLASRAAEDRLHLAMETGRVMAWELDDERRYIWVDNVPLGLRPVDLLGRRAGEVMPVPAFVESIERVYTRGVPVLCRIDVPTDGQPVHLHLLCAMRPEIDGDGKVVRVIGAAVDLTELNIAEQKLQEESRRKDAFLATLAHELRNPMAPIRYAVAMLAGDAPAAVREQATAVIARQAEHMARLLDDLLDMSRITRNAIELRRDVLDLRTIAKLAAENVGATYGKLRHRLTVSLSDDPVLVDGDPTRLQQVLGNLLDNAAKYTPRGGEIHLDVGHGDGKAIVRVVDNGIGIAPEKLGQVFELFTQLQGPGRGEGGLGIGLAVVKQLVELHGGRVTASSEGPGKGTQFTVTLPLAQAPPSAAREMPAATAFPSRGGKRVLVVDDNTDTVEMVAVLLRDEGYEVSTAYDGRSALVVLDRVKPDIVLLDLGLPDMTGLDVAREMRRRMGHDVALVAVSGWGQAGDRAQTASAGFDLHLVKPVEPHSLIDQVAALSAARQPRAEAEVR
jgi:signal transduction histidine kinase/ActR/RegA family two-component response regulator